MRTPTLLLAALCASAVALRAQTPARPAQPTFRAETTLVEVSAVVLDRHGAPITDLAASEFDVFEDDYDGEVRFEGTP